MICPKCNFENDSVARFCENCGTSLKNVSASNSGKRKWLTFLIVGLGVGVVVLISVVFYIQLNNDIETNKPEDITISEPVNVEIIKKEQIKAKDEQIKVNKSSKIMIKEPEMVFVQGGVFMMGSPQRQKDTWEFNENPQHRVTVSHFYISKYEVTQSQWKLIMGTSLSQQRAKTKWSTIGGEGDNYPMCYVNWEEVQEFIVRLNAATGKNYRLPTEAEWEYSARGGAKSNDYSYSGSNMLVDVAWFEDNSGESTHVVGTKQPNILSVYDMSGNVEEWCYDAYGEYSSDAQVDPKGALSSSDRVIRGGDYLSNPRRCTVTFRNHYPPDYRMPGLGFRLACSSN